MKKSEISPIILSRTPFRLSLGGGSTDLPSYYKNYGGFIFAAAINMYMDIFIKKPATDDLVHMHYLKYESEASAKKIKHTIGREALKMMGVKDRVLISFNADTPAGTGLGSSGACAVGLLKGLAAFTGKQMTNLEAAEKSFELTQNLGLPDGKQDPYICALGGFTVLEIAKSGLVKIIKPKIAAQTADKFLKNTLLFYTGVYRKSAPILKAQNAREVLELKHQTKEIGQEIYRCFLKGDLDRFGELMDKHWRIKKAMSSSMSSDSFDEIYSLARKAGASGGKIIGAGGGGYFMFYCPSEIARQQVRRVLKKFNLREMNFSIDERGARTEACYL